MKVSSFIDTLEIIKERYERLLTRIERNYNDNVDILQTTSKIQQQLNLIMEIILPLRMNAVDAFGVEIVKLYEDFERLWDYADILYSRALEL